MNYNPSNVDSKKNQIPTWGNDNLCERLRHDQVPNQIIACKLFNALKNIDKVGHKNIPRDGLFSYLHRGISIKIQP